MPANARSESEMDVGAGAAGAGRGASTTTSAPSAAVTAGRPGGGSSAPSSRRCITAAGTASTETRNTQIGERQWVPRGKIREGFKQSAGSRGEGRVGKGGRRYNHVGRGDGRTCMEDRRHLCPAEPGPRWQARPGGNA